MADILSVLANGYASAATMTRSPTPYKNVDAASYVGSWEGVYADNQKFKIDVSNVNGFRAQVRFQSGSTLKYETVLIKDNSFKIADSKFTLIRDNRAQIKTVVVDPASGQTMLNTAYADRKT